MEIDDEGEETGTPLIQQRRFLILMSLAVLACYSLGIDVRNEGEYSGFAVKLAHPDRAIVGLWTIWAWALLRYVQRAYERISELWGDILQAVYSEDRKLARRAAEKEARRQAREGKIGDDRPNVRITSVELAEGRQTLFLRRGIEQEREIVVGGSPDFVPTEDGGRKYEGVKGTYSWVRDSDHGVAQFNFQMTWSPRRVRWTRFLAWCHSTLWLPAISEHVTPILIATCAVVSPFLFHRGSVQPLESPKADLVAPTHLETTPRPSGSTPGAKK
jgi:hypothetical protein